MPTDPKQMKRVEDLQGDLEQILGLDTDTEIGLLDDGETAEFALEISEDAAKRIVDLLRKGARR